MQYHRNSQKGIYIPGAAYFCTTNTYMRHPWFEEPLLREVLVAEIRQSQKTYDFELYGYAVMPDHVHILFMPGKKGTYSDIMKSIKKQSSHEINRVIGNASMRANPGGAERFPRHESFSRSYRTGMPPMNIREHDAFIRKTRTKYIQEFGTTSPPMPFKWHKSFHDHYIRDARDFMNHVRYIERQPVHHGVEGTVYVKDSLFEGAEPLPSLQITKPGNPYINETRREPRVELIARAVGSELHLKKQLPK